MEKNKIEKSGNNEGENKLKVAKVAALRNTFYLLLYKNAIVVFLTSLISMGCALFFVLFFARQPVPPQYIPLRWRKGKEGGRFRCCRLEA